MHANKPQPIINNAKRSPYYREGVKSFKDGLHRQDNVYEPKTYKSTEWDRGWFNCKQTELRNRFGFI